MTRTFVARVASMLIVAVGATSLSTPASATRTIRVALASGPCPSAVAQQLMAVAEKACKREGKEALVIYMSCTDGVADFNYQCI